MSSPPDQDRRLRSMSRKSRLAVASVAVLAGAALLAVGRGIYWEIERTKREHAVAVTWEQIKKATAPSTCHIEFSPDGHSLLLVGARSSAAKTEAPAIRCDQLDVQTGQRQFRTEIYCGIFDQVCLPSYTSDGSHLLVPCDEGVKAYGVRNTADDQPRVFQGLYIGGISGPISGKYVAHTGRGLITYDPAVDAYGPIDEDAGNTRSPLESCLQNTFAETRTGKPRASMADQNHRFGAAEMTNQMGRPTQIAIAPDGHSAVSVERVTSLRNLHVIRYWDLDARQERAGLTIPGADITDATCVKAGFGKSGPLLMVGRDSNRTAIVWDSVGTAKVCTITFPDVCSDLAASYADGKVVVAGISALTRTVSVYDGRSGQRIAQWTAPSSDD